MPLLHIQPVLWPSVWYQIIPMKCSAYNTSYGPNFNIKTILSGMLISIIKIRRLRDQFHLYNENSYAGKMASLYWDHPLIMMIMNTNKTLLLVLVIADGSYPTPWVGVTYPVSTIPLSSYFVRILKTLVTCQISHSYLTGAAAAELQWRSSNMNVIQGI